MTKTSSLKTRMGFIFFCALFGVLLSTNAKAFQNRFGNNLLVNDLLKNSAVNLTTTAVSLDDSLNKTGISNTPGKLVQTSPSINSFGFASKLTAPPVSNLDELGWSVAIDGETAIVSDPWEDIGSNTAQGAAYIFVKSNGLWVLQQTLLSPEGVADERFGYNVALKGDRAVVASLSPGSQRPNVFIYVRSGSSWTLEDSLSGSGTEFLSGSVPSLDGDTLAIGSYGNGVTNATGVVFIFTRNGSDWVFQAKLFASDGATNDNFGNSVAVSGDRIIVGASGDDIFPNNNQGSAYIFNRTGTTWMQETKLIVPNFLDFGTSCDLEGDTAVIANGGIAQYARAFVFVRENNNWTLQAQLTPTDPNVAIVGFGTKLDLSGNNVVINASGSSFSANSYEGAAYIFSRSGTVWSQTAKLYAPDRSPNDNFSRGVGISGATVIAGANRDNNFSRNTAPGSAYIFSDIPDINTDLRASSDHGDSQTDNITNTRQLSIDVANVTPGSTVELYRDNVLIGSQTANSSPVSFTDTVPGDGQFQYNSREVISGVPSLQSSGLLVTIDTVAPTLTIDQLVGQNDPTSGTGAGYFVRLSDARTSFSADYVSLAESTADLSQSTRESSGSGKDFAVLINNVISNGQFVRATVPGGTFTDIAGNYNLPSTSTDNTVTIDNVRPTVTVNQAATQPDPTRNLPLVFDIIFSEPVTDLTSSEIVLSGSTANTIGAVVNLTGSGAVYTATISGISSNGGYVQVTINMFAAMDRVGNTNLPSTSVDNRITIDNVRPTVTINQAPGQSDPSVAQPLNYRVVFSEPVTGFDSTDVSMTNSTANVTAASITVTGSGANYNVSVTNITSSGLVRASVPGSAAEDSLGNLSNASTSTDNTISFIFRQKLFDFDGDGKTDVGIFRPTDGSWWYTRSSDNNFRVFTFGTDTDIITPGDFTGDGKSDIAVFRPSTGFWFVQRSEDSSFFSFPFGTSGDVPAPADYDGDGKTDPAVFRPSTGTWFVQKSNGTGTLIVQFGADGDKPVTADYDGDGRTDIAIFRPSDGSWWYLRSSDNQFRVFRFGVGTDKPVQGDWTGDGKADIAVFRPETGIWFVQRSEDDSFFSFPFGQSGDVTAPGDYDGDGKTDAAVFRPSTGSWFIQRSTAGTLITTFGTYGDRPIPNSFVP